MELHQLKPTPGSTHSKKRVGRGHGSGNGKTAGAGHKGQRARSGGSLPISFEGGQTPLFKRLRKVGFTNPHRKEYATVNLDALNRYDDGTTVTVDLLKADKLVKQVKHGVKILGNGELEKKLTVVAHKFTASAEAKIKAVGGQTEVI